MRRIGRCITWCALGALSIGVLAPEASAAQTRASAKAAAEPRAPLALSSPDISSGSTMPGQHTCDGLDVSPVVSRQRPAR